MAFHGLGRRRMLAAAILPFVAATWSSCFARQAQDSKKIGDIVNTLVDQLRRIETLRYKESLRIDGTTSSPTRPTIVVEAEKTFAMDGDHYLINISTYRNGNRSDVVEKVLAFDGNEFQRLDVTQSILSTNKSTIKRQVRAPYESRQLITMPFAFLLDRLDYQDYQALKDRGSWASLIAAGKLAGEEKVGGLDCWVVSIGDRGDAKEVRLDLAEVLDNYPIRSEITGKGYRWVDRVEEYRVVESPRGPIVIPLKVTTESEMASDAGWSQGRTVATLDPSSLKVNEPIDPGEFTLSKTQVDLYQDLAKQEGYRRGQRLREPAEIARKVEGGWRGTTSLIFALSATLLVVGSLTLIVRRLRGSRTSS